MAKKKKKLMVKMQCGDCKEVNYYAHKTKNVEGKLSLKKHCSPCRKHTVHKEAKK
ncbi:MAG: 50S ribosomal protein L33 [Candidatus Gribaldobacteria bacterium]|nr:50S ribosomal protein L33 [Candidatus Gribaldobacteria bacterium]